MTVREVAARYGVTPKFLRLALEKLGYDVAGPDDVLSSAAVARFDSAWGDKIRSKRPAPQPEFSGETDVQPVTPPSRRPTPHVMRIAHARITGKSANGYKVKALLDNPGLVHAIDAAGTHDGDPWHGAVSPGAVHYYGGPIGTGPPAACGTTVRAVLGDEFVPEKEAVAKGQCPKCARLVEEGKGFRNPPDPFGYRSPYCERYVRIRVDDVVKVKDCSLDFRHGGPHRARDGAEWEIGLDDYVPSPDEVGSSITKASSY